MLPNVSFPVKRKQLFTAPSAGRAEMRDADTREFSKAKVKYLISSCRFTMLTLTVIITITFTLSSELVSFATYTLGESKPANSLSEPRSSAKHVTSSLSEESQPDARNFVPTNPTIAGQQTNVPEQISRSSSLTSKKRMFPPRTILTSEGNSHIGRYRDFCIAQNGEIETPWNMTRCLNMKSGEIVEDEDPEHCRAVETEMWSWYFHGREKFTISNASRVRVDSSAKHVKGTTAYFLVDRSYANIAHWAMGYGLILHIVRRAKLYAAGLHFERIVLDANSNKNAFNAIANASRWQGGYLRVSMNDVDVYVLPHDSRESLVSIENEHILRYARSKAPYATPLFLVWNMSVAIGTQDGVRRSHRMCFDRVVTGDFVKGRFFMRTNEVPLDRKQISRSYAQFYTEDNKMLADDALFLKNEVLSSLNAERGNDQGQQIERWTMPEKANLSSIHGNDRRLGSKKTKSLVYLVRRGRKRTFADSGEALLRSALKRFCKQNGFSYREVDGGSRSFLEQVREVYDADICIGLHGANLVNALLLNPRACLVEVMPFGFTHSMYTRAGESITDYSVVELSSGEEYRGLSDFTDRRACIHLDVACKKWYRSDNRRVSFLEEDAKRVTAHLLDANIRQERH